MASTSAQPRAPALARPSASIILVSPSNQILLLRRVRTSTSFPSAHVFPGGNVSEDQDGKLPPEGDAERHRNGMAYRRAAIRECFEESGILLARRANAAGSGLLAVGDRERDAARKDIHANRIHFVDWVHSKGGSSDTEGLTPFTRFFTPVAAPRRFSTQMYLYFLPLAGETSSGSDHGREGQALFHETTIPIPTTDGGIEHTATRFLPAWEWLSLAARREVVLFPPQYLLLHLLAPILCPQGAAGDGVSSVEELERQSQQVQELVRTGEPPWADRVICPRMKKAASGQMVVDLSRVSPELEGTGARGEDDRVLLMSWEDGVPRDIEVKWRKDVAEAPGSSQKL